MLCVCCVFLIVTYNLDYMYKLIQCIMSGRRLPMVDFIFLFISLDKLDKKL